MSEYKKPNNGKPWDESESFDNNSKGMGGGGIDIFIGDFVRLEMDAQYECAQQDFTIEEMRRFAQFILDNTKAPFFGDEDSFPK